MASATNDIVVPVEPVFYEAPPVDAVDQSVAEPDVVAPVVTTPNVPTTQPAPASAAPNILPPIEEYVPPEPTAAPQGPAAAPGRRWTRWRVVAVVVAGVLAGFAIGRVTSSSSNKKSSTARNAADQSAASNNGAQPGAGQRSTPAGDSATPPTSSGGATVNGQAVLLNIPRHTGPLITDHFTVSSPRWTLGWAYDCTGAPGGTGAFNVKVFDGSGQPSTDGGVDQNGAKGSSVVAYTSTGERYLWVTTNCVWAIRVTS